jgi:hypothetical protein
MFLYEWELINLKCLSFLIRQMFEWTSTSRVSSVPATAAPSIAASDVYYSMRVYVQSRSYIHQEVSEGTLALCWRDHSHGNCCTNPCFFSNN